ncbi:MAG: phage major capsid protein, partial [Anaerolineales bacterium]
MGSALDTFNDFMDSTGPSWLTGPADIVNEAVKNNYLLRRFLRGKGPSETLQGGSTIKDSILFDEKSTFQYYQPNETFAWSNPQVLDQWEIDWRFSVDHMSWTDHEIELNVGGQGRNARHQTYKTIKRSKEQRLWTSLFNGMEDSLFAKPVSADMEGTSGTKPYSLPAFINAVTDTDYLGGALQNIDPGTEAKWRNKVAQTGALGSVSDFAALADALFPAFDALYMDCQFMPPPSHQEYFENPSLNAMFIATSRRGQRAYVGALRASQDTFVTGSRQDPSYMKPQYAGLDMEYVAELDTAKLYGAAYDDTGSLDESSGGTDAGPRYYFINANYLKFVFHTTRYFYQHPTMKHPNQPF